MRNLPGKPVSAAVICALFSAAAVTAAFFAGPAGADPYIIWSIRAPRILLGFIVGAGLALSGAVLQSIMENPLAEPYVTGTSAGAALGAVSAIWLGLYPLRGVLAFGGGIAATAGVYLIASHSSRRSPQTLILAGVSISSLFSAFVLLIMVLSRESAYSILFFLTGNLQNATLTSNITAGAAVLAAGAVSLYYAGDLDILALGDEQAAFLGVDVEKARGVLLFSAALAVAGCVSAAGIIGFAGLIVPHIVRLTSGASHRRLIPLSALAGGGFLVLCDAAARSVAAPLELPVGVVTAFFGAPFFLYLLLRKV